MSKKRINRRNNKANSCSSTDEQRVDDIHFTDNYGNERNSLSYLMTTRHQTVPVLYCSQ
jgi:hypothetical protein